MLTNAIPAWARWMLSLVPLGDRRAEIESDVTELFVDRLGRYGRLHAHRRLCGDIISLWRTTGRGRIFRGDPMLQDVRFALRLIRKHPAPVGIAIAGLALAIGVATAVFSLVDASMLRPYGMDDPASVVSVAVPGHSARVGWPYAQFLQMREGATLSRVEASLLDSVRFSAAATGDVGAPKPIQFVSGGYLQMLGGRPSLGRTLEPSDDTPLAPAVIVVSQHFWKTELEGDPSAIGKVVRVNGVPVTLVGVLQPEFTGPVTARPAIWAPFAAFDDVLMGPAFGATTGPRVDVVARLASDVVLSAAQDNLSASVNRGNAAGSAAASSGVSKGVSLSTAASPMDDQSDLESSVTLACIAGIIGLVLALACANTANLLMAAAMTRVREVGVRLAMGATRARLVRQLVTESLLLGLMAGALGFVLAIWLVPIFRAMVDMPADVDVPPDGRVLWFTVAVALICGVGAGLSPARYGARGDVLAALHARRGGHNAGARSRLRTSFVGFQAAVSMLLLVSAALLARTAMLMTRVDIGFDVDHVLAVSLQPQQSGVDEPVYVRTAIAAVRDLPFVQMASLSQFQPFGSNRESSRFTHDGRTYQVIVNRSDAGFFSATGLRILRGRAFTADEVTRDAPVALVSDSLVRAFFGGSDPIGQPLTQVVVPELLGPQQATIIGVVADAMLSAPDTERSGEIYRPISATRGNFPSLIVRTASPGVGAHAIEDALRRIDSRVRPEARIVREKVDAYLGAKRRLAWLLGPTAMLALLLAALGVYGVTAFVVSQRTQEVSVRMAIGASSADVMRLLMKDSLRPVLVGLGVGLILALVVGQVSARMVMLSGVSPHDPLSIGVALSTLIACALVAVIVPARRAARTDPASVLREI